MIAALSTLLSLTCGAEASPALGAAVVEPGVVDLGFDLGMHTALPSLRLGASVGLTEGLDLSLRYATFAGLAHDVALSARGEVASGVALELTVAHGFYVVDQAFGIDFDRARFGDGLTTTPAVWGTVARDDDVSVGLGGGVTVKWTGTVERLGETTYELEPSVPGVWLETVAEWPGESSTVFVRVRAVFPVTAGVHVIGFFPWAALGWHWGFP